MKENLKVKILCGLPASGKSTFTKKFIEANNNYVSVSRDYFRLMLKNQAFCENNIESLISDLVDSTIILCLKKKQNVIIDNTNLKLSYINHFVNLVKEYADIEFELFDTPTDICIQRDLNRDKPPVGKAVILRMEKDLINLKSIFDFKPIPKITTKTDRYYLEQDTNLPKSIICDIDGTLAFALDRNIFDESRIYTDKVNEPVANILRNYKGNIILASGRKDSCKELTEKWLIDNNIPFNHLFMRKADDLRKDSIVKNEIFNNEIKDKYFIEYILDDRNIVVDEWRKLGLLTLQVYYGDF